MRVFVCLCVYIFINCLKFLANLSLILFLLLSAHYGTIVSLFRYSSRFEFIQFVCVTVGVSVYCLASVKIRSTHFESFSFIFSYHNWHDWKGIKGWVVVCVHSVYCLMQIGNRCVGIACTQFASSIIFIQYGYFFFLRILILAFQLVFVFIDVKL